jgi:hypothetical protein
LAPRANVIKLSFFVIYEFSYQARVFVRLGWKSLPRTNTPAYYENWKFTAVKFFIRLAPDRRPPLRPSTSAARRPGKINNAGKILSFHQKLLSELFNLDKQADRQAGRQTDKQTGRQADRQTSRQADKQTHRHMLSYTSTNGGNFNAFFDTFLLTMFALLTLFVKNKQSPQMRGF